MNQTPSTGSLTVGVLTYDYDPAIGGLGALAKTYVHELRKQHPEARFIVISPSRNVDERGSLLGRLRWRKSGGCPLFSLSLLWSLRGIIRRHGIQLLHVHSGSGGVFLLRRPSCPVVVTAHHTYRQEVAIVFAGSAIRRIWKTWMAALEKRTYRLATRITCISADTAEELLENYAVPRDKITVIENPVPVAPLDRFRGLPKSDRTLLFVGRLEERKGVMLLLQAFLELKDRHPDLKLRLVGNNLIGHKIHRFIDDNALRSRVALLGYLHDPFRFREMSQATALVVPSLLEGFGLVAAEGMLLGTCVVASDAPGLRSIVEEGKTGFVFRSGDKDDLVRVLERVLLDGSLRSTVEQSARSIAEKRFDVPSRAHDLMALLRSV